MIICARRLDNLDKIGTCLQRHRLLKLAQEEIEYLIGHMLQIELRPLSPQKENAEVPIPGTCEC